MNTLLESIAISLFTFVSTNIDDLFVLMLLFSQSSGPMKKLHIYAGQLLGMTSLLSMAIMGSLVRFFVPLPVIGLLGIIPLYLGLRSFRKEEEQENDNALTITNKRTSSVISAYTLSVAGLTIANGGDNIGIYIPYFAGLTTVALSITVIIFLLLTVCWLKMAAVMVSHPYLNRTLQRYHHRTLPWVLIALSIYILWSCDTLSWLWSLIGK
jgi:cadmium resistance transport/sequestration family protein